MTARPLVLYLVVVAGLIAAVLAACSGVAPESPPATVVASSPSQATDEPIRLLVVGDSIAIPAIGCGHCVGFDQQYATYLEGATGQSVILDNKARPAAQIDGLQALLDSDASIAETIAVADIVVVSIGFNNQPAWEPTDPCHAPVGDDKAVILATLEFTPKCIADTIAAYKPKYDAAYARIEDLAAGRRQVRIDLGVYNNTIDNPDIREIIGSELMPDLAALTIAVSNQWNAMQCEVARAHGFVCADLYHAFNGRDGKDSVLPLVSGDYTHPSEAGQAVIADLLERVDVSILADR